MRDAQGFLVLCVLVAGLFALMLVAGAGLLWLAAQVMGI